ncbi:alpha/beta-hydrolase [Marasmius fiardii PR-910]|nr:alpha/beta-hydrolase [Marasmius fiardii PR-910]
MPGFSSALGKLIVHGQKLVIYPAAFETEQERLSAYAFPSDLPHEDVELTTSDGITLKCLLLRAGQRSRLSLQSELGNGLPTSQSGLPRATVIMFHGNGYHVWHHAFSGARFVELGCDVLLVSYRGYGFSGGTPSEKGLQRDSQAALDYVLAHPELKKKPIVVHGHSLGGAVSIDLVHRNPDNTHAIIIENTFLSIPAVAKDLPGIRHVTFAINQTWESQRRIVAIPRSIPILMFSGSDDEVVPPSHMKKLWEISRTRWRSREERHSSISCFGNKAFSSGKEGVGEDAYGGEETGDRDNTGLDVFETIPDGTHGEFATRFSSVKLLIFPSSELTADTWARPGYWSAINDFLGRLSKLDSPS